MGFPGLWGSRMCDMSKDTVLEDLTEVKDMIESEPGST